MRIRKDLLGRPMENSALEAASGGRSAYVPEFRSIRGDDGDAFVLGPDNLIYGSVRAPQGMLLSDYQPPREEAQPFYDAGDAWWMNE